MKIPNKIQYIVLITDHYKQAKEFYTEKLDFTIDDEIPAEEYIQFKLGDLFLALFGRKQMEKVIDPSYLKPAGGALYTLSEVEDVDKTVEELKAKGVTFIKEPITQPWGQRTAYFTDPDGNIWEVQKWMK